ncbi:MAG TPA: hypothetical protein GX524_05645, partial [Firmicutes bacterium]|nr:hypothetical protein [Bacillota bacterium]
MYEMIYGIGALSAMFSYSLFTFLRLLAGNRRFVVMGRLSEIGAMASGPDDDEDDVL